MVSCQNPPLCKPSGIGCSKSQALQACRCAEDRQYLSVVLPHWNLVSYALCMTIVSLNYSSCRRLRCPVSKGHVISLSLFDMLILTWCIGSSLLISLWILLLCVHGFSCVSLGKFIGIKYCA